MITRIKHFAAAAALATGLVTAPSEADAALIRLTVTGTVNAGADAAVQAYAPAGTNVQFIYDIDTLALDTNPSATNGTFGLVASSLNAGGFVGSNTLQGAVQQTETGGGATSQFNVNSRMNMIYNPPTYNNVQFFFNANDGTDLDTMFTSANSVMDLDDLIFADAYSARIFVTGRNDAGIFSGTGNIDDIKFNVREIVDEPPAGVPEPGTAALLALGLGAAVAATRRRETVAAKPAQGMSLDAK